MKAIHIFKNKKKKIWRGILFLFAFFSFLFINLYYLKTIKVNAAETLEDGIYTINGELLAATSDKNSMGNDALKKPFTLVIKNGEPTLKLEMVPLTAKAGTTAFTGYLAELNYFPGWEGYVQPTGQTALAADVESYYEDIYDAYNDVNTGLDANVKGKLYPHYMTMPVDLYDEEIWVQVYVPVMEAISTGSGRQYARLDLNWSTLTKTGDLPTEDDSDTGEATTEEDSSKGQTAQTLDKTVLHTLLLSASSIAGRENVYTAASLSKLKSAITAAESVYESSTATQAQINSQANALSSAIINLEQIDEDSSDITNSSDSSSGSTQTSTSKKLNINSLSDGIYKMTGKMYKIDKATLSMSNDAINHNIKLTVKSGKYYLTMDFNGLQINSQYGYLGRLKYFTTGYSTDKYGSPTGSVKAVTVNSYQKDSKGNKIKDSYGSNYPDKITFPMISEAKKNGWVPLQVFVPIMEAISSGSGTQAVYLKLDLSSLSTADSSSFSSSSSSSSSSDSTGSSSSSSVSSGSSSSDSTQTASELIAGSSLPGVSQTAGSVDGSSADSLQNAGIDAVSSEENNTGDGEEVSESTESTEDSSQSATSVVPELMSFLAVLAGGLYKGFSRKII